jgi:probable H4MPT-linked C1 transfer pathway protein
MVAVLGLDIGGANLKAAHTKGDAVVRPFALWRAPELLAAELRTLLTVMPAHDVLAVTMTGELCDCFATKAEGVHVILQSLAEAANGPARVWTIRGRFVELETARADPREVAAANWLALAHLAARRAGPGAALLLDIGSTTTDIIYLDGGLPRPRGHCDLERLRTGELVYTGVRRTPVCAVLGMEVAAELFATMLDVQVVLGFWPECLADTDTADRRPVTHHHAQARLARLLCADTDELSSQEIHELAQRALQRQIEHISQALDRVLHDRPAPAQVILSGSGEVLGRQVCVRHPRLAQLPLVSLTQELGARRSEAAAAYAVAVLAQEQLEQA